MTRHLCTNENCKRLGQLRGYVDSAEWATGIRVCGPCRRDEINKVNREHAESAIQRQIWRAV